MNLSFNEPWILSFLTLPALLLIATLFSHFKNRQTKLFFASTFLICAITCLIFSLAGMRLSNESTLKTLTAAIDISRSIDARDGDEMLNQLREFGANTNLQIDLVPFATAASSRRLVLSSLSNFNALRQQYSQLDSNNSNLEVGVREAATNGSPVILLSDGFQTQGDVFASLEQLNKIPLYALVPREIHSIKAKEFSISRLDLSLVAPMQASIPISVSLGNSTDVAQSGTLVVFHDTHQIDSEHVTLKPGEEIAIKTQSDPSLDGIKKVTATLTPDTPEVPKVTRVAYLSGQKREKLLMINGSLEDKRLLADALTGQSFQVQDLTANPKIDSIPQLKDFSVVILNNTALSQLPTGAATLIKQYVEQGGGFLTIGGNRSFGLGGYIGSPLEEVFPVQLVPPQSEQKRLNVAVELVIDKSRSMAEDQKIEFAKDAARQVIGNLKDEDFVGVIGFDASPFEVVRLDRLSENRAQAMDRVGRLYAAKQTNLFPAMDQGRRRLESVPAGRKHMIILTDGKLPDADMTYVELTKEMRQLGISLSTVLVGTDFDFGYLKQLAEIGGGSFYQTADPSSLPRIFLQDVKIKSGEKTMKEQQRFFVKPGPNVGVLAVRDEYPDMLGFVETRPKSSSKVELLASGSEGAYPLLASGTFGAGKSVAFTSDANGRWSKDWAAWSKFVPFWTRVINNLRGSQDESNSGMRFDIRWTAQGNSLNLDLVLFNDPGAQAVTLNVIRPGNISTNVALSQISKGRYQGRLNQISAGRHEIQVNVGKNALTPVAIEVEPTALGEQENLGFNTALLEELTHLTGGKINPSSEELRTRSFSKIEYKDLSWIPLALALMFVLLEVLTRTSALKFKFLGKLRKFKRVRV